MYIKINFIHHGKKYELYYDKLFSTIHCMINKLIDFYNKYVELTPLNNGEKLERIRVWTYSDEISPSTYNDPFQLQNELEYIIVLYFNVSPAIMLGKFTIKKRCTNVKSSNEPRLLFFNIIDTNNKLKSFNLLNLNDKQDESYYKITRKPFESEHNK